MCLGLPMRVHSVEPGFAWACRRGEQRRVNLALVGECQPGDWLLVFLDSARERIDAARAAEIDSALELLEAALAGEYDRAGGDAEFALPSSMDRKALAELTGAGASGAVCAADSGSEHDRSSP